MEPLVELYNHDILFDYLGMKFHKKRGYLGNFLTSLKKMESENKIKIIREVLLQSSKNSTNKIKISDIILNLQQQIPLIINTSLSNESINFVLSTSKKKYNLSIINCSNGINFHGTYQKNENGHAIGKIIKILHFSTLEKFEKAIFLLRYANNMDYKSNSTEYYFTIINALHRLSDDADIDFAQIESIEYEIKYDDNYHLMLCTILCILQQLYKDNFSMHKFNLFECILPIIFFKIHYDDFEVYSNIEKDKFIDKNKYKLEKLVVAYYDKESKRWISQKTAVSKKFKFIETKINQDVLFGIFVK